MGISCRVHAGLAGSRGDAPGKLTDFTAVFPPGDWLEACNRRAEHPAARGRATCPLLEYLRSCQ